MEIKKKEIVSAIRNLTSPSHREIEKYSRNLTLLAADNKLMKAYDRENECEKIEISLRRRTIPNVLLVGEAGCGKTAIVEQIAINSITRICKEVREVISESDRIEDCVDSILRDKQIPLIFDIDLGSFVAGAKYRGDFEERLTNIISEVKSSPYNIILFFDEAHLLTTLGSSHESTCAAQLLKPVLARGEIRVIGATTINEAEIIKEDKALTRRFNFMKIMPVKGNKVEIARNIASSYAKYHSVDIKELPIEEVVDLVDMHLEGAVFPNGYINVIDETFAAASYKQRNIVKLPDIAATLTNMTGHLIVTKI